MKMSSQLRALRSVEETPRYALGPMGVAEWAPESAWALFSLATIKNRTPNRPARCVVHYTD
jgi:hypothetical protein